MEKDAKSFDAEHPAFRELRAEIKKHAEHLQQIAEAVGTPYEPGRKIVESVRTLVAKCKSLEADKNRIDWLSDPASNLTLICLFPSWGWDNRVDPKKPAARERLRQAIDEARAALASAQS